LGAFVGSLARSILGRPTTLAGTLLVIAGVVFLGYALGAYFEMVPGSKVVVPTPAALAQPRPTLTPTPVPPATPTARPTLAVATRPPVLVQGGGTPSAPVATPRPVTGAMLAPPHPSVFDMPMVPSDADDRPYWGSRPRPGIAARLEIPAIKLETDVVEGGIVTNGHGEPEWQTVPFVALQYRELGRVGERGNAVISGHVVTINEGNVFRDLNKVSFGDSIQVQTDEGSFTYIVEDMQLVKPNQVEVMEQTKDYRLTLITCGGEFDSRSRSFSDRLVVVTRLADWQRMPGESPTTAGE
jgi:LPXTG-site transpeptidase (sortase) family protein